MHQRPPELFRKIIFFYFTRLHFHDILGPQMDPPWDPKKVPKLFSKVIFGGPRPPPQGPAELRISEEKCRQLRAKSRFPRRGGVRSSARGGPFWDPQKIKKTIFGSPKMDPLGYPSGSVLGAQKITLKNYRKNTRGSNEPHFYGRQAGRPADAKMLPK